MGYIGPCVINNLRDSYPGCRLIGMDMGYFAHCLTGALAFPEIRVDKQYFCDIRKLPEEILDGVDVVVHLAAISNDPMGNRFERATEAINGQYSALLAKKAKSAGVKSFVFASSCSMYGASGETPRTEDDDLNPLSAYARSKVFLESTLMKLAADDFVVTCLRFSTACGMSERLRLDLVLNDFVASAISSGRINILSDGSSWRPLIHVKDMARAIEWAVERDGGLADSPFVAVNVGRNDWNFNIKELAEACADVIGHVKISVNSDAMPDKRSYRVDFSRFKALAPNHQPLFSLEGAIRELQSGLNAMEFNRSDFRETWFMRLKVLAAHIEAGRLNEDLQWVNEGRRR